MAFARNHGFRVRIGRYIIYLALKEPGQEAEKAPAAICRKIAALDERGGDIEVWVMALKRGHFLYIDECIEGTLRVMRSLHQGPRNIGSDEMVTINQLVTMVAEIAGKEVKINNVPGPEGVRGRNSDNRFIHETIGWKPTQTLSTGLRDTYRWIQSEISGAKQSLNRRCIGQHLPKTLKSGKVAVIACDASPARRG